MPAFEERKLVTILFADITGSTTLGERFDPERWRVLLQRFFSVMTSTIEAWGGTVQKFMGDSVMATFGVPIVREDDAERALRAACQMLDRLSDLNIEFKARHGVSLAIRVGVNTGEVMAASDQNVVTGDAVNVAARLEQMAEPGTVLAGERTYAAARDAFIFGEPESREVRGKSAPVIVRQVLRPLADSLDRRKGMQVAMVGRDQEVESLASLFHEAMDANSPRLALISGPAGIGKSRLLREFLNLASARHPETTILQGRCPSTGDGLTYWALGELLRRECQISLDDPAASARERLRQKVETQLQRVSADQATIDHTVFSLAFTAGITIPENPLETIRPVAVDNELSMAWPRFISAYAAAGPVILVLEDLHWAGDRLVAMMDRLLARSTGPVLLVTTARPELRKAHPEFGEAGEGVAVLALRALTAQQSSTLLDEILEGSALPETLRRDLVATADGNPLFLEEIIRRLIDGGMLVRRGTGWQVAGTLPTALPDTVLAVLGARIDGLPAAEKRALQEAAVMGRVFWEAPVRRATADPDVTSSLLALESKGLVSVHPTSAITGELEFIFKHALVRDVAYASLPRVRRARAHAEAARWLQQIAGDRSEEQAELIAHHYRTAILGEDADLAWADDPAARAELRALAFEALLAAGAVDRKRFAVAKALELHQDALRLAVDDAERARALEAIGDDHEGAFHGDEAVPAWEGAIAALGQNPETRSDRVRLLVKCAKMTAIRWGGFKVLPPTKQVDGYVAAGLTAGPEAPERGWLLALRAYGNTRRGDPSEIDAIPRGERIKAGEEAVRIGRQVGDIDLEVLATRALSGLAMTDGDYVRAMDFTRKEEALVDRIVATRDRALGLFWIGLRYMDTEGHYEEGLALMERSYQLAKQLAAHDVLHATHGLLYGNASLGRWERIDALGEEHVKAFHQEPDMTCPFIRGGPLIAAAILAHRGDIERAREMTDLVPMNWSDPALPEALHGLALLALGDAVAARQEAEQILAAKRRLTYEEAPLEAVLMVDALVELQDADGLRAFLPEAERIRQAVAGLGPAIDRAVGLMHLWEGDAATARPLLGGALAEYERLGNPFEAARTREYLASALPARERAPVLDAARRQYERLGATPSVQRVRSAALMSRT
ncbi:MAG TPA: adenylate/guanylate cyclase domain-containing protein [Candidatus Angelobacter sp.]|nr:adenylate/guanylate cyclase domain-containing protein [Candidatus Angelobacter sp.]